MAARRKTFVDHLETMPLASWYTDLIARVFTKRGNGAAVSAFATSAGHGGLLRLGVVPAIVRPTSGISTYVVDRQADWRDRLVLLHIARISPPNASGFDSGFDSGFGNVQNAGLGAAWPGITDTVSFASTTFTPSVMSTGLGMANGVGAGNWHLSLVTGLRLYARTDDGALCIDIESTAGEQSYALALMLHATEKLGGYTTPAAVPVPSVVGGNPILIHELNALQDGSLYEQLGAYDRADFYEFVGPPFIGETNELSAMALGPKLSGNAPQTPAEWRMRSRSGREPTTYIRRRQRLAGGSRRFVSVPSVTNTTDRLIDTSIDWRDRLVFIMGRRSTSDIRPGAAGDTGYNAATKLVGMFYTHTGLSNGVKSAPLRHALGLDGATSLVLYAGSEAAAAPGGLYLRNDTGSTQHVPVQLIVSPQLGFRTKAKE